MTRAELEAIRNVLHVAEYPNVLVVTYKTVAHPVSDDCPGCKREFTPGETVLALHSVESPDDIHEEPDASCCSRRCAMTTIRRWSTFRGSN